MELMRFGKIRAGGAVSIDDAFGQEIQDSFVMVLWDIGGKEVIEAAIFTDDDDDVFNGGRCSDRVAIVIVAVSSPHGRAKAKGRYGENEQTSNGLRSPCSFLIRVHSLLQIELDIELGHQEGQAKRVTRALMGNVN
ncbi:MAG: hypothetical protein WB543_18835 [Candidatus Acidiferrum sp.]